jgi:hypothetical protein
MKSNNMLLTWPTQRTRNNRRKLAVDYIPYWLDTFTKPEDPMYEVAKRFVSKGESFYKDMRNPNGPIQNCKGNLKDEVNKLKNQSGKDVIVYSGIHLFLLWLKRILLMSIIVVNPIALGGTFLFLTNWRIGNN